MFKTLKKFQLVLVSLTIVLLLVGCGSTEEEPLVCPDGQENINEVCVDIVVPDTTAPVITGAIDIAYVMEDVAPVYTDGITVNDNIDGDITSDLVIDSSLVDLSVAGTYVVTLTSTDVAGNIVTVTYNVVVTERELTGEERIALDVAQIDFTDGIDLPSFGEFRTAFFWSSSHPQIITDDGIIILPPVGSDPVVVTLTASCFNGITSDTVDFEFTIQPRDAGVVTSSELLPYTGTSEEYVTVDDSEVEIFYMNNGNVPYIDIQTYINMIDGAIESTEIVYTTVGDDVLVLTYEVEYEDFDLSIVVETFTATIDFTANTFTVNNYGFFENYVASTETDYGEGLNYVDADYVDPVEVTIPLGDYSFDLVIYDDGTDLQYLMPFHVTNLLFAGGVYFDVFYNGEALYGIDTFGISGGDEADLAIQELARTSSYNDLDAPTDIKEATYHFMALALDYFYGLKEDQEVETYYDYLAGFSSDLISGTDAELYQTMFDIAYGLDDLHTSHSFSGYYSSATKEYGLSINDLGPHTTSFYEGLWDVQDIIEDIFGTEGLPDSEIIDDGKTVIIYLEGFDVDSPDAFKVILDNLPATVENVVIDLAYNTGGNLGAVLRIFGYMTEETIAYHSQNPADDSAATWYIESDYVAYEYNWFIKTSSVTFSAANLMASMAKELGLATIIGQDSSGGASSIGVIMAPDGSTFLISTNNVLSTRVGNEIDGYEYLSIEYGIEVDYFMTNVYSETQLINIIEQVNNPSE